MAGMTAARTRAVVIAALLAGGGVMAIILSSDHQDNQVVWAILQPVVGWSFVGTGLYASRRRPDSRTGLLMIAMGFAWFLSALDTSNSPVVFTFSLIAGGLFGATFLHLAQSFPTGRLLEPIDRGLVIAGYVIFPFAFVPALLFAGQEELDCPDCPDNLLQVSHDATAAGSCAASAARSTSACSSSSRSVRSTAGARAGRSSGCS